MKKFGIVLGAAAVAVVAGCKDPDFKRGAQPVQSEVKSAGPVEVAAAQTPAEEAKFAAPKCTCKPGTRHTEPCACGTVDCACIVMPKAVPVAAEPETTVYIVQNGDYLAKISKKFNVTIPAIKKLNALKSDVVRVGQKLKLPGKIDVGVQTAPAAAAKATKVVKVTTVYTGATKEYVVKNGDTLGAIAYSSGINIRQLKSMNGLKSDALKVGQKLKIPAEKVVAKAAEKKAEKKAATATVAVSEKKAETPAPAEKAPAAAEAAPVAETPASAPAAEAAPAAPAPAAAPAAPATFNYTVLEGEDITAIVVKFGVTAAEIRALNNLGETDTLAVGQTIKLPAEAQQ